MAVGGIYTLASGFPFSAFRRIDPSNTGTQGIPRPDQLRNGNLPRGQRTPDHWFDITAFSVLPDELFGLATLPATA